MLCSKLHCQKVSNPNSFPIKSEIRNVAAGAERGMGGAAGGRHDMAQSLGPEGMCLDTLSPKPATQNPKPETRNLKPGGAMGSPPMANRAGMHLHNAPLSLSLALSRSRSLSLFLSISLSLLPSLSPAPLAPSLSLSGCLPLSRHCSLSLCRETFLPLCRESHSAKSHVCHSPVHRTTSLLPCSPLSSEHMSLTKTVTARF